MAAGFRCFSGTIPNICRASLATIGCITLNALIFAGANRSFGGHRLLGLGAFPADKGAGAAFYRLYIAAVDMLCMDAVKRLGDTAAFLGAYMAAGHLCHGRCIAAALRMYHFAVFVGLASAAYLLHRRHIAAVAMNMDTGRLEGIALLRVGVAAGLPLNRRHIAAFGGMLRVVGAPFREGRHRRHRKHHAQAQHHGQQPLESAFFKTIHDRTHRKSLRFLGMLRPLPPEKGHRIRKYYLRQLYHH